MIILHFQNKTRGVAMANLFLGKTNSTDQIDFSTGTTKYWGRRSAVIGCSLIILLVIALYFASSNSTIPDLVKDSNINM